MSEPASPDSATATVLVNCFPLVYSRLTSFILCHQHQPHAIFAKTLLSAVYKVSPNSIPSTVERINSILLSLFTPKNLALLISVSLNNSGNDLGSKLLRIQKIVCDVFERNVTSLDVPVQSVWYETNALQSEMYAFIEAVKHKTGKLKSHSRKLSANYVTSFEDFVPPKRRPLMHVPTKITKLKIELFSKLVHASQALLLPQHESAHYLFASLTIDAMFKTIPLKKSGAYRYSDRAVTEYCEKVVGLFKKYEQAFANLHVQLSVCELLTMLLRYFKTDETIEIERLIDDHVSRKFLEERSKLRFTSMNRASLQKHCNEHHVGMIVMAYKSYMTLPEIFKTGYKQMERYNYQVAYVQHIQRTLAIADDQCMHDQPVQLPSVFARAAELFNLYTAHHNQPAPSKPISPLETFATTAPNSDDEVQFVSASLAPPQPVPQTFIPQDVQPQSTPITPIYTAVPPQVYQPQAVQNSVAPESAEEEVDAEYEAWLRERLGGSEMDDATEYGGPAVDMGIAGDIAMQAGAVTQQGNEKELGAQEMNVEKSGAQESGGQEVMAKGIGEQEMDAWERDMDEMMNGDDNGEKMQESEKRQETSAVEGLPEWSGFEEAEEIEDSDPLGINHDIFFD